MDEIEKAIRDNVERKKNLLLEEAARREEKRKSEVSFLLAYQSVLEKDIMSVIQHNIDHFNKSSHQKASLIMHGEIAQAEIDSSAGKKDGIKIWLDIKASPIYIWFTPNVMNKKVTVRIVFKDLVNIIEEYDLDQVSSDFIQKIIIKTCKLI